jgi:cobalt-zinc-cadmium resistance protein CzcA
MTIFAQNSYNLSDLITLGKKQNLGLKTTSLEVEMNKKLQNTAFDLPKTDFSMQYGNVNNFQIDYSFNVVQNFSLPKVYQKKFQYNQQQTLMSEKKLLLQEKELIFQIKSIYYHLSFLYEKNNLLEKQDSLQKILVHIAEVRVKTGEGKMLEKLSSELLLKEIENQRNQIQNDLKIQKEELKKLLNLQEDFEIFDKKILKNNFNITQIDVQQNPQLLYLQQQIELQKKNVELQKTNFLPDLRLGYYNMQESKNPNLHVAQLGIAIPIFNVGRKANLNGAKIQQEMNENHFLHQKQVITQNGNILISQWQKSLQNLEYYEKTALPQAEKIQNTFQKAYQSGEIAYTELAQSRLQTFQIAMNYIQELANYNQIVTQIEFLIGN